ncbi:MAG: hypothetical protein QOJ09_1781 [Actinomycetota bacterium]|nr:hypothetical protein [Actinomycetota bacterium]
MKYWTVAEATAYLPRLRELLALVQDAGLVGERAGGNGRGRAAADEAVQAAIDELEAGDIVLRQLGAGLVDFPARGEDGVVYLLCYRLDEPDLTWWHRPEDGFAGRRRLPRDAE